ncbi:MAG: heme ABC exporter ATP-binding protein CcmA [Pseudomonadota bacterium]
MTNPTASLPDAAPAKTASARVEAAGLSVEAASIRRGGRLLLEGVSFAAPAGAFAALRGPNGSGKTSLLRVLAGLAPLAGGVVRFGAATLTEDPEAYRERIMLAGHLDAVKPSLSVLENLRFWAAYYGAPEPEAASRAALERFGLAHRAEAPAGHCSAGQKRRLGLARLAAAARPLWLLDEPTVALDKESVAALSAMIEAHCAAGGVVVAATHQDFPIRESLTIDVGAFEPKRRDDGRTGAANGVDPFLDGFGA